MQKRTNHPLDPVLPSPPYVKDTLVLWNGTLVPGNFLAAKGLAPWGGAYDSGTGELFVTDLYTGTVSVISDTTDRVVATVAVGSTPEGVAYDSGKGEVFVANQASNTVSVISDATDRVVATVQVGSGPIGVAYDSGTGEVFVSNRYSDNVSVISDATDSVVATVAVGYEPFEVAYDMGKGEVFVANGLSANVSVISDATDSVVATVAVGPFPFAVAYDSGMGEVFVANDGSGNVSVISDATDSVVATVAVGANPEGAAYDSAMGEVFVANYGSNTVSVVSDATDSVVATVTVGSNPVGVAYDSGKGEVFVANSYHYSVVVSVVSEATDNVVATVAVGSEPFGVADDWGKGEVFVTDALTNAVSVISDSTDTVVAVVPVGSYPAGAAYDSAHGEVFVTNEGSDNVSVISDSTDTVVATVAVGCYPQGVAYDPEQGEVFVANSCINIGGATLSVINDTSDTIVSTIDVGANPMSIAFDSARDEVFVENEYDNDVSVISGSTNDVVATIPVGDDGGFLTQEGYDAGGPSTVAYDPATGEVFVTNYGSNNVSVISDSTDAVVASVAVGSDPSGVVYDGLQGEAIVENFGSDNVSLIPDSINDIVPTVAVAGGPMGLAYDPGQSEAFVANQVQGTISILAWPAPVHTSTYSVTFQESGLTGGTSWSVRVGATTLTSRDPTAVFTLTNGTYAYSVRQVTGYTLAHPTGSLVVNGSSVEVDVPFQAVTYTVVFSESNLPAGMLWYVNASGGTMLSGRGTTHTTNLTNGPYTYRVASVTRRWSAPSGSFEVSNGPVSVPVTFSLQTYKLTFAESGTLTKHQEKTFDKKGWTVVLNGTPMHSTGTMISFSGLPNGSYPVLIYGPSGFDLTGSGTVVVHGTTGVSVKVTKGKTVNLTFHNSSTGKKGLKGASWCVAVDGDQQCSTKTTTKYKGLTPGSYNYAILPVTGFTITATVKGSPISLSGTLSVLKSTTVKLKYIDPPSPIGVQAYSSGGSAGVRVSAAAPPVSWGLVGCAAAVLSIQGVARATRRPRLEVGRYVGRTVAARLGLASGPAGRSQWCRLRDFARPDR